MGEKVEKSVDGRAAVIRDNMERPTEVQREDSEDQLTMIADVHTSRGATALRAEPLPLPAWSEMTRAEAIAYMRTEVLLGVVIAFAQVPESVSFAFLAHVRPSVALHSAWIVGLVCALFGGRPGMICGASGAFAAVISTFIGKPERLGGSGDGVELLFPSVMLAGALMGAVRLAGGARFITLIPEPVMVGFCNGLALVIARAQLHPFAHADEGGSVRWKEGAELGFMLLIMITSMLIMEFVPKLPSAYAKLVPSSLLAIVAASLIELLLRSRGFSTDTIGDVAQLTAEYRFPVPFFLDPHYDVSVLRRPGAPLTVLKQAVILCAVGVVESLMTTEVVTEIVKTPVDRDAVVSSMGAANVIAGLLGGMGGNSMIALSQLSCLSGGRGRLAPTMTALFVMGVVMGGYPLLNHVPISALTGIMVVVVLHTFRWSSLPYFAAALLPKSVRGRCRLGRFRLPVAVDRWDALVALVVTIVTVVSNLVRALPCAPPLAGRSPFTAALPSLPLPKNPQMYAVAVGVILASVRFAWAASHQLHVSAEQAPDGSRKVYSARGLLFFGNAMRFSNRFDPDGDPPDVELHIEEHKKHDLSAQTALSKLQGEYAARGKQLTIRRVPSPGRPRPAASWASSSAERRAPEDEPRESGAPSAAPPRDSPV